MSASRAGAVVLCNLLFTAGTSSCASADRAARLLVLYSFSPDSIEPSPFDAITRPALEKKLGSIVEVRSEYLSAQSFHGEEDQREFAQYLQSRYSHSAIDVIVPVAFPALMFIRRYIDQILPGTPVVFVAVESRRLKGIGVPPNTTGVAHVDDWEGALREILRMQPQIRQVVVVAGSAVTDHEYLEKQKELLRPFENRVKFRYVTDLPLVNMLTIVSKLPKEAVVLESAFAQDSRGQTLTDNGGLKLIEKASSVPVYALVGDNLGQGFVGGPMVALRERYLLAADLLYRVVRGEKAQNIPVQTARPEHVMAFDGRQLSRWHISEDRLPPGSQVAFREQSGWNRYKKILLATGALCMLETSLVVVLLVQRSRRRRAERRLLESGKEIRNLAGRLLVAQEDERKRIACELHDDVSQQLAAVSILTSSIVRNLGDLAPILGSDLKELQNSVYSVAATIRDLSHKLRPSLLEMLGLSAALQKQTEEFSRHTGIRIQFRDSLAGRIVASDVALCLFRIAQEGLHNLEKHSGVREGYLALGYVDDSFELIISDHGRGFEPERAGQMGGLGLTSMKERVRLVNGHFTVESAPGEGTCIRVRVPDALAGSPAVAVG
jgi:signal transduction histidine kinase